MPKKISMKMMSGEARPNHVAPYSLIRSAKAAVSMALSNPESRKTSPTMKRRILDNCCGIMIYGLKENVAPALEGQQNRIKKEDHYYVFLLLHRNTLQNDDFSYSMYPSMYIEFSAPNQNKNKHLLH